MRETVCITKCFHHISFDLETQLKNLKMEKNKTDSKELNQLMLDAISEITKKFEEETSRQEM